MGIRLKIFSIIGLVFLVTSLITWVATVTLVQSQYIDLEADNVKKDTSRGVDALNNKVDQLAIKTPDWSSWDDTYQFINDHNKAYIISNIQSQGLQNLEINFMLFFDSKQQLVLSTGIDIETGDTIPIPKELTDAFANNSKLLAKTETDESKGIIGTTTHPILLAAAPILQSDTSGPVRGTLVFAQYLMPNDISKLGDLTHLNLAFKPAIKSDGSQTTEAVGTSSSSSRTQTYGSKAINGYQVINDIYDKPLLVATVEEPRSIFQETKRTLVFYMLVVLGISLSAILVVMYTTGRIVRQNRTMETERTNKKEIEKQVIDRTREAKEEHARLSSAIESLDAGLLMTFTDKREISYNNALLRILGTNTTVTKSQSKATTITLDVIKQKLEHIPNFDLGHLIDQCQTDGQPFHVKELSYENRILTVFGAPIMVQLDKIIGVVVLVEDITEQKVMERSKDEFFSIASHELRTPLTSIKGNTSMILDFYKDALKDPQLNEMVVDVHDSAVRLIEIVNDFLDTSRLEQGKMNFDYSPVNLEEVIESVAYEMKTVMEERKIYLKMDKLTLDRLPKVWADKNKLKQVIYNLVGNGAKFTETGGITVSAELDGEFVRVDVTDTGRGMPADAQKLLFHKFQQAGSSLITRDTTRGTGLGLYICKMIVESMGGTIGLTKSEEGVGSTFSFRIPVVTEELMAEAKTATEVTTTEASARTDSTTGMTTRD